MPTQTERQTYHPTMEWSITWLTSAAVDDWADSTEYDPFDYVEDDSSFWITVEGGTSSGTGVADDTGVTWYEIDKIYDANGGDLSQMTNYLFWAQRQTVDIDAGTGTQKGQYCRFLGNYSWQRSGSGSWVVGC
jgi:hypothetical protein